MRGILEACRPPTPSRLSSPDLDLLNAPTVRIPKRAGAFPSTGGETPHRTGSWSSRHRAQRVTRGTSPGRWGTCRLSRLSQTWRRPPYCRRGKLICKVRYMQPVRQVPPVLPITPVMAPVSSVITPAVMPPTVGRRRGYSRLGKLSDGQGSPTR